MKNDKKTKVIAVIGPTASGKTSLAIKLAKKYNGEMINTDSRQVYKYMDIGTAKGPVKKITYTKKKDIVWDVFELEGAPFHLIDLREPNQTLTLAEYQDLAFEAIDVISSQGKLPILVGGTGLYIDAIYKGYEITRVPPNYQLRKELNDMSTDELQEELKLYDKKTFENLNESDKFNKHRLIRKIELIKSGKSKLNKKTFSKIDILFLTPKRTREELYDRINKRVPEIIKEGLIDEVKLLMKKKYNFALPAMTAISYPLVKDYLEQKITREELIEKFSQGDRNYAKRQITWFKRYKAHEVDGLKDAFKIVEKFIANNDNS